MDVSIQDMDENFSYLGVTRPSQMQVMLKNKLIDRNLAASNTKSKKVIVHHETEADLSNTHPDEHNEPRAYDVKVELPRSRMDKLCHNR